MKERENDLRFLEKIREKITANMFHQHHNSYVRFANGRVQSVQLCVIRGQSAFLAIFRWTFWAIFGQFFAFVQVRGRPKGNPKIFRRWGLASGGVCARLVA